MKAKLYHLTLVTNKGTEAIQDYLQFVKLCIDGGITCVQLREKYASYEELFHFGKHLKDLLDLHKIPLIINDNVSLCIELDATGVHLGQSDQDAISVRELLGANKVIGLSVNNIEQVLIANDLPIDYIGVGAIFPTHSKPDIETIWELDGLKKVRSVSSHPIIAIGGITQENAADVIYSGAEGIAAIGAFHNAKAPKSAAYKLSTIIKEAHK